MPDSQNYQPDWSAYYQAVDGRPPRNTLLEALERFEAENSLGQPRLAVDLGCGEGRDTIELLRRGWQVLGIDAQEEAISLLLSRPNLNSKRLKTRVSRFENLTLPESVDLINASFSLPFCPPEYFPGLWQKIVTSLRSGGRFSGQLFGERDSWAVYTSMNHHTLEQVKGLLQPFELEVFEEEDHLGKTALGEQKHWHIFQIVARKQ